MNQLFLYISLKHIRNKTDHHCGWINTGNPPPKGGTPLQGNKHGKSFIKPQGRIITQSHQVPWPRDQQAGKGITTLQGINEPDR